MPILRTRLYKPVVKQYYIQRETVMGYLDRHADNPVTLVVAAAGYGKSVAISQWLDKQSLKYGWISLDEDTNDFRLFLLYLMTSVREVFPETFAGMTDLANAVEMPPVKEIAGMLVNDIGSLEKEFVIVLDDFHLIVNPEIYELINEIIKYPPENLKLFIISRHDPPLKLSSLKAYDHVNEIRMADLQFSTSEIVSLFKKINHRDLVPELAEEVFNSTEGWIIGIRLILKDLSDGKNILDSLKSIYGDRYNLSNYLVDEILEAQPEMTQKFLLLASLFDRFNSKLLEFINPHDPDFILNETEKGIQINRFIESSMFIIPLDNENRWYRFHHLIQEFLRKQTEQRYTKDKINDFYSLASEYFENNNFLEEAISCALEGQGLSQAIRIIDDHWNELLLRDNYARLERWLGMLPAGASENFPVLLLTRAMLNDTNANYSEMKRNLDRFEALYAPLDKESEESRRLRGEYHALRSGLNYFTGKFDYIIEHADQAIELLCNTRSYLLDYAILFKAFALHIIGKSKKAIRLYKDHLLKIPPDYRLGLMRSHSFLPLIYIYQADINALKNSAKLTYQISKEEKAWVAHVMANKYLGTVNYIQNNLDKVEAYTKSTAFHRLVGRPLWVSHTLFFGVLSYLTSGQHEKMKQAFDELISFLKSFNIDNFDDLAYSFQVEMALRQNDLPLAIKHSTRTRFNSIPIIFSFYFTQLTEVKLLIRKSDDHSLKRAYELLEEYIGIGMATRNMNFLLQAYTLMAIWHKIAKQPAEAVQFLHKALVIGRPGRYIRMFADYGEEMKELLLLLPQNDLSDPFVSNILNVIEEDKQRSNHGVVDNTTTIKPETANPILTPRELEILILVSQGLQNKEIADQLHLSLETINKYLYYAYQKLHVKNRAAAVARAKELNLIL